MKIQVSELHQELNAIIEKALIDIQMFQDLPLEKLNFKARPESWSALECLDHLHQYAEFYLPEIEKQVQKSHFKPAPVFKAGILGNYFANSMRVQNNSVKKMKSPKDKLPSKSAFTMEAVEQFKKEVLKIQSLLKQSQKVDLTKTKSAISLTPMIKLRLGDTFRFYLYHIDRHLWQAKRSTFTSTGSAGVASSGN